MPRAAALPPHTLAVVVLTDVLKQPGCPICRVRQESARDYLKNLLYEGVNDPDYRLPLSASLGYCPPHSALLAEIQTSEYERATGASIIYEQLAALAAKRLTDWRRQADRRPGRLHALLHALFRGPRVPPVLPGRAACRACENAQRSANYHLEALCELLQQRHEEIRSLYDVSDGLCLAHLCTALEQHSGALPEAARLLIETALAQLACQRMHMEGYLEKQGKPDALQVITPDEHVAWKRAMGFFTGLSPEGLGRTLEAGP